MTEPQIRTVSSDFEGAEIRHRAADLTVNGATSSVRVARTAAANARNRQRYAARLAHTLGPRLADLDKPTLAALLLAALAEVERRGGAR